MIKVKVTVKEVKKNIKPNMTEIRDITKGMIPEVVIEVVTNRNLKEEIIKEITEI